MGRSWGELVSKFFLDYLANNCKLFEMCNNLIVPNWCIYCMCVGPKGQFAKNKQKYKVQQQSLNSNIGTCDLAKHMHGKIWDIS